MGPMQKEDHKKRDQGEAHGKPASTGHRDGDAGEDDERGITQEDFHHRPGAADGLI